MDGVVRLSTNAVVANDEWEEVESASSYVRALRVGSKVGVSFPHMFYGGGNTLVEQRSKSSMRWTWLGAGIAVWRQGVPAALRGTAGLNPGRQGVQRVHYVDVIGNPPVTSSV